MKCIKIELKYRLNSHIDYVNNYLGNVHMVMLVANGIVGINSGHLIKRIMLSLRFEIELTSLCHWKQMFFRGDIKRHRNLERFSVISTVISNRFTSTVLQN